MSAAIQAKDAGANPVIFEKMPLAGGNTLKASAGMNASQTIFQKRTHRPTDGSAIGEYLVDGLLRNIQEREIPLFVNSDVTQINQKEDKISGVTVTIEGTSMPKPLS